MLPAATNTPRPPILHVLPAAIFIPLPAVNTPPPHHAKCFNSGQLLRAAASKAIQAAAGGPDLAYGTVKLRF
ncbi:hypothetical protein AAC387_Pa03g1852 [Persea americana]